MGIIFANLKILLSEEIFAIFEYHDYMNNVWYKMCASFNFCKC